MQRESLKSIHSTDFYCETGVGLLLLKKLWVNYAAELQGCKLKLCFYCSWLHRFQHPNNSPPWKNLKNIELSKLSLEQFISLNRNITVEVVNIIKKKSNKDANLNVFSAVH